jgi:hypothetical protein
VTWNEVVLIPRLIRKFFSGITDYPHQEWRSDDDDEAGMDMGEPDTDEWHNPWAQPLWDGKSSPYTDAELDVIRGLGKASD